MSKKEHMDYAIYKGDEFVDIGKASELAEKYGLQLKTIYWKAGSNRWKKRHHKSGYIIIPLPDEEEGDEID